MKKENPLVVQGVEPLLEEHKEEIAEEFGIQASPAYRDVVTQRLLEDREDPKKVKTNEDM